MIKISVVSYNNEVPASTPSAVFGREGRTLGRSKDNYFVLEDPKNMVSRTQACVRSDGLRHTITNLSRATPIFVNGQEIDADREYELRSGDEIEIGLYLLRAEALNSPIAPPRTATVSELKPQPAVTPIQSVPTMAPRPAANMAASAAVAASMEEAPEPVHNPEHQALIQAFLKGAGIPSVTLAQGLTPEFMETVGKMLAISVQGAMDLNALRALVKREVKADVTQVVLRNNNPLKFLPDGETVLTQMFRKKMPGFMSPTEAMQDTFEDLHAHQMGVVAGIRAVMADILRRMNPERLDGKIKDLSFLESMLPANRKARLWDLYIELFGKIAAEAEDEFQGLFGQAFVQAYEQEIERVKDHAQSN